MLKFIFPLVAMLTVGIAQAQHTFKAIIRDSATKEVLIGATALVKGTTKGASSDRTGHVIIKNVPDGTQIIVFKYIGYEQSEETFQFPVAQSEPIEIFLVAREVESDEVIVSSTRTGRAIQNVPTRVETLELEEIEEKSNMRPANVSMILHESTGIQVQQTSATSGNASIRIQGLDGRYTQLLKDNYPNFGNFASGLSILEIPPLDLKQVEVIKGPASTLYGAGAIAGVVNFISKTPQEKSEYSFLVNQSHIGQSNIGGFTSSRNEQFGYTLLALVNFQQPYDVDNDDFTELPKSTDFTINPKLYYYPSEKTTFMLGNSYSQGDRTGGDIQVIKNAADPLHTYFEKNNTLRSTTTLEFEQQFTDKNHLTVRSSFSVFDREIKIPNYEFKGTNYNSFSDVSYVLNFGEQTLIVGGNSIYDKFSETGATSFPLRDFTSFTGGVYAQHTWDVSDAVKLESGLRTDVVQYSNSNYEETEVFMLPRISALFTLNDQWSSRIGGGLGYKTPTIFTEQTEGFQYRNVTPLNNVTSERSYGGTADITFRELLSDDFFLSWNQMFFYTAINNATVLHENVKGEFEFSNEDKPVHSLGFETNIKVVFQSNFTAFIGYTLTDARAEYLSGNQFLPLLPKNKLNLSLIYEKAKDIKIGLEGYLTDRQYLSNGTISPRFWEFGAMVEKTFGIVSFFVNAENFTDTRQSRYKRVVNEPHSNPTFDDIWTHTEGFTFSGGVKVRF